MKRLLTLSTVAFVSLLFVVTVSQAKNSYLNGVNSNCGTSFSCGICHIDPKGGGPLTAGGDDYVASGSDTCTFCADVCGGGTCTDADADAYYAESNCGTGVDCNDADASVNEGAIEVCDDGIDNDCDGKIDCSDNECDSQCNPTSPEVCNDGIDNDGDRKTDCADRDCRKDPACTDGGGDTGGSEGKGKTCTDGQDNDGDGVIDCDDSDCASNRACR